MRLLVEIKGVQLVNKGAHLMLLAVLERLQALRPDARIALAPHPNAPYEGRAALGAWQKLPLRWRSVDLTPLAQHLPAPARRLMHRYGVVTEHDVDAVLDASGYAYGDAWGPRSLQYVAAELRRYARRRRPYVFLPQAFGPFERTRAAARHFGRALPSAALVCPRDPQSRDHLTSVAPALRDSLRVYPDFTIGVPPAPSATVRGRVDAATVLLIPNANMVRDGRDPVAYVELFARAARWSRARGYAPRVLNHEGAADAPLCRAVGAAVDAPAIVEEADPRVAKALIGTAAAVVCSRFHGCVGALSQGVPCVGTSWSHKYQALFEDFGVREWLLDVNAGTRSTQPGIEELLERALGNRAASTAALAERRAALLVQVDEMWSRVAAVLRGVGA